MGSQRVGHDWATLTFTLGLEINFYKNKEVFPQLPKTNTSISLVEFDLLYHVLVGGGAPGDQWLSGALSFSQIGRLMDILGFVYVPTITQSLSSTKSSLKTTLLIFPGPFEIVQKYFLVQN